MIDQPTATLGLWVTIVAFRVESGSGPVLAEVVPPSIITTAGAISAAAALAIARLAPDSN